MTDAVRLPFDPYPHQRAAHAGRKRFSVLVWHRGAGKTVWSFVELALAAFSASPGARFAYIAPLFTQAKDVGWGYLKLFLREVPGVVFNEAELSARLPNDVVIRLYGANNPDGLRGLHFDGVVVDEVKDMKPQVWGEILRPALTRRDGWAVFIGTPKGVNLFHEIFFSAQRNEEWFVDLKRVTDTGLLGAEEIQKARDSMTPSQFAAEMLCDFAAAVENVLCPLDLVMAATQRRVGRAEFEYAPKVIGIDVARYGDDRTVIFPRQGIVATKPRAFRSMDLMEVASHAAHAIDTFKPDAVFIDQGGVGGGVVDRLRQLSYDVIAVDFGGKPRNPQNENKRAEMWRGLADWLKQGGCIPDDAALVADLTAPTYTYANARGRFQLESKDDMRARGLPSPDLADALALTFAEPVAMRSDIERFEDKHRRGQTVHEYDPYAAGRVA